jgi:hypothetical protein
MVSHVHRLNDDTPEPDDRIADVMEQLEEVIELLRVIAAASRAGLTDKEKEDNPLPPMGYTTGYHDPDEAA